ALQQNLGGGNGASALADELDARVEIGLARREPLGERQREPCLDQHVQAPALDLGPLELALEPCRRLFPRLAESVVERLHRDLRVALDLPLGDAREPLVLAALPLDE